MGVWAEQPADFFDQAILDMDGILVETTGQCKQGMDIAYDGTWGYHPLVLTLANTGEVLGLVNRPGNRPSHEGAAAEVDRALARLFPGRLPHGAAPRRHRFLADRAPGPLGRRRRVRFIFGYDAAAEPERPGRGLAGACLADRCSGRRATQVQTQPRQRPDNVKEAIVVAAASSRTSGCASEEVAEFNYRPTACRTTYRMIVVRKNLSVEKGRARAVR